MSPSTAIGLPAVAIPVWSKPSTARAPLPTIGGPRTGATTLALLPIVGPTLTCAGLINQAVPA